MNDFNFDIIADLDNAVATGTINEPACEPETIVNEQLMEEMDEAIEQAPDNLNNYTEHATPEDELVNVSNNLIQAVLRDEDTNIIDYYLSVLGKTLTSYEAHIGHMSHTSEQLT